MKMTEQKKDRSEEKERKKRERERFQNHREIMEGLWEFSAVSL